VKQPFPTNQIYGEQPYQINQFNPLYEKVPFTSYGKYSQDQPQFVFDSINTDFTPKKFNFPYSTTSKPQFSYESIENYVTPNVPRTLFSSAQSYAPPSNVPRTSYSSAQSYAPTNNPQISYGSSGTYVNPIKQQLFYGLPETYSSTSNPQSLYGISETYASTKIPEFSSGSTESYATSSKPRFFYSSNQGYSDTSKPQYTFSSTETYGTTSKPQFPYGSSESYFTTIKPQFTYNRETIQEVPKQPSGSLNFDLNQFRPIRYNKFDRPLGVLYHQQHDSEIGSQYHNGILIHQQNNFNSIPVNLNYDSHKNDVQYPPLKDYETQSTTQGPLKFPAAGGRPA